MKHPHVDTRRRWEQMKRRTGRPTLEGGAHGRVPSLVRSYTWIDARNGLHAIEPALHLSVRPDSRGAGESERSARPAPVVLGETTGVEGLAWQSVGTLGWLAWPVQRKKQRIVSGCDRPKSDPRVRAIPTRFVVAVGRDGGRGDRSGCDGQEGWLAAYPMSEVEDAVAWDGWVG